MESVREHLAFYYECWLAIRIIDDGTTRDIAHRALENYWLWLEVSKDRTDLLGHQFLWKMREIARRAPELNATPLLRLADRAFAAGQDAEVAIAIVALAMQKTAAASLFMRLASSPESYRAILSEIERVGFADRLRDLTGINVTS